MVRSLLRSLAVAAALAACTPASPPNTGPDTSRTEAVSYGVIASMRPVAAPAGNQVRNNILVAIGFSDAAAPGPAVEFIIRDDGGNAVSVVQTNDDNFRPGERVVLTHGARTRIARAPGV